jgi:uncharacterized membrane protein HdeD (DUF308 family)
MPALHFVSADLRRKRCSYASLLSFAHLLNAALPGREAIEEARMVLLPGIQTLFGFQLIAVFIERFKELTEDEQLIHFSATVLVTIAIVLIMTPAYHRLAEQTTISKFFVWLASWLIAAAMVPLMLGLTLEVYLLGLLVIGDPKTSLAVSTALFGVFSMLWFVFPLAMRRK